MVAFIALAVFAPFDFYTHGPYDPSVPRPESILGYAAGEKHTVFRDQERVLSAIAEKAPDRVKVDAIYTGPAIEAAAKRHHVDFQVSSREPQTTGFTPLPLRWRIEATFGTATNRYRRLTRNLEQYAQYAENAYEIASFRRVLRVYAREINDRA